MLAFFGVVVVFAIIFGLISFGTAIFATFAEAKERNKDNEKAEVKTHCKILEKNSEKCQAATIGIKMAYMIEHVVIEDDLGNRVKLRNMKTDEILLAAGDTGVITYRGDTIYAFTRDV